MNDRLSHTLIYAAVLGIVCAALLAATATFTAPLRRANEQAEHTRHILAALGVPFDAATPADELLAIRDRTVRTEQRDGLTLYRRVADGRTVAVAVEFSGMGLWGPIRGILALEPDLKTIRAVTFYEQEETPGLGGEIQSEAFRMRFAGKEIVGPDGRVGIVIRRGEGGRPNGVDGITGATITTGRVEAMLNDVARKVRKAAGDE